MSEKDDYLKSSDVFEEGVLRKAGSCPIIRDRFTSLEAVSEAIRQEGVKECGLIMGMDYTLSNRMQGQKTFGGKSLHEISSPGFNPYQQIICIFGETLEPFDDNGIIPVFGFGDAKTKGESIFCLKENYHILVIAADGQVTDEDKSKEAIVEASKFPLSIIMVGVGDGPWEVMEEFDDGLPERNFDNFQFVNFHEVMSSNARNPQAALALHALMEIPDQYKAIKELRLLQQ